MSVIGDCDYEMLHQNLQKLKEDKTIDCFLYGKSLYGNDLIAFHKGDYGGKQFLITGGIHAREYISCFVVIKLIQEYDLSCGCFFIPLLNPDGVDICLNGLKNVPNDYVELLLRLNNYSTDFSMWKANGRGVDLNVNFDALWGKGKFNKWLPGSENFVGECPCSEVENIALLKLIKRFDLFLSLAYHSKGEVIYHGFSGANKDVKHKIKVFARFFAKLTGYKRLISKNSVGGLSDYLSLHGIPSLTVEVGNDALSHPISYKFLNDIYSKHYQSVKKLFNFVREYDRSSQ